jgi:predicted esterase
MRKIACLVILAACGSESSKTALFELPGDSTDFYALPFPNDLRREADGTIDLSAFPTNSLIADKYREAADTLEGFGLNQAIFARFDGTLDSPALPDPMSSIADTASVYLVDIDPDSPQRGERSPIAVKFRAEPTRTLGENHLVARPYPGFGLAEGTTYALVITDRVGGVKASPTFEALLGSGGDTKTVDARAVYQPLLDWLDEPGGDERGSVVSAAVFTTQRVTQIVPALRKGVLAAPAPVATGITPGPVTAAMSVFTGQYMAPNFQSGDVPYRDAPTGQIMVTGDTAISQRMETMRFGLTIPAGPVPANGFPIAIYAHGTGGDHLSFVDDGTGAALAAQGIAMISTDQVLHGPRNPNGDEQIDFFNVANPFAMRDNSLQGTADAFAQLRLAQGMSFADGGRTIRFDATKVYFFGHSQGGLTGPGFVAFEPSLSGAVFSGTGGLLYLGLLYKTKPLDVSMLLATFLRDDPVDEDNPSLAMVQMWVERADGANYAPMFVRRPLGTPRNIFQTEGFTDTYTPNPSIEAFAIATGGDIVELADTADITGLTALRGRAVKAAPIATNVGGATAALGQYKQRSGSDGHFVVFDNAVAKRQAASFLGTLAATGTATVVP